MRESSAVDDAAEFVVAADAPARGLRVGDELFDGDHDEVIGVGELRTASKRIIDPSWTTSAIIATGYTGKRANSTPASV